MKLAFFDTHHFEKDIFLKENINQGSQHELFFLEPRLTQDTVSLAKGFPAVCAFVNDKLNKNVLTSLKEFGVQIIALRSAGFNHVDLAAAKELKIPIVRVPEYSPYAVAEHAVCLMLALNRKIHRSYARVREGNFALDGLVGFDLHQKTVGIIGTGKIGSVLAKIMNGFGCKVLAYDISKNPNLSQFVSYVTLKELYQKSDIISLHVPLTPDTRHIINEESISNFKNNVMIINTGRGALIETKALIDALKLGKIGYAGLDVYEEEEGVFFQDLSNQILQDDLLARLLTFPNVLLTAHQGFLTHEALKNIAHTTLNNVSAFEQNIPLKNLVQY